MIKFLPVITFLSGAVIGYIFKHSKSSSINHYVKNAVSPEIGSIFYCKIYNVEHTGIYIGNGKIVELLGTGQVIETDYDRFTQRTSHAFIYLAANENGKPLTSKELANRAQKMVGTTFQYNFVINNCHKFVAGTILNNYNLNIIHNSFFFLEKIIKKHLNNNNKFQWKIVKI